MRNRLIGSVALLAILVALPRGSRAQTSPEPASPKDQGAVAPHDLSGQWSGGIGGGLRIMGKVSPMLPEAQAKFDANTADLKKPGGTIAADPTFRCEPPGVPHIYGVGAYLVEIMQTPDRIFLFYESIRTWRTIWMNNRPAPDNAGIPLWLGFSKGHWEGNDLVVDTTGFNDTTWLNSAGYPNSDALHVIERFHRVDHDHMTLDITIDDTKSYTQPWKMGVNFTLKPTWDFSESFCLPQNQSNFQSDIMKPSASPTPAK